MKNGQTSLYDMSDVKLKKGGKGDGKGTGLATPTPKPSNNNNSSENGKKQNNSSKPGGQGKSLSGGSKGKTVSNNKNDKKNSDSPKSKNKKKKKSGWGFTAKPYKDDDKNKITGKTSFWKVRMYRVKKKELQEREAMKKVRQKPETADFLLQCGDLSEYVLVVYL